MPILAPKKTLGMRGIDLATGAIGAVAVITVIVLLILVECGVVKKNIPLWVYPVILSAALVPLLYMIYGSIAFVKPVYEKRPAVYPVEMPDFPVPNLTKPMVALKTGREIFVDAPERDRLYVNTGLRKDLGNGVFENTFASVNIDSRHGEVTFKFDGNGKVEQEGSTTYTTTGAPPPPRDYV